MGFRRHRLFTASALAALFLFATANIVSAASPYAGNYRSGVAYVRTLVGGYPPTIRQKAFIFTAQVHADGTFDIFVSGMSLQVQRTTVRAGLHGTVSDTGKMHITKPVNVATGDGQITGPNLRLKCVYQRTPRVVNYYDLRLKLKAP
jgi:hypothetical protein